MTRGWGGRAAARALGADVRGTDPNVPGVGVAVMAGSALEDVRGFGVLAADSDTRVGPASVFHAASLSKLVSALGVLCLVGQGRLDLDEDVNRRLQSWQLRGDRRAAYRPVTLRMLLSHHGGVVDPDGSFGTCEPGEEPPDLLDVLGGTTASHPCRVAVTRPPGEEFSYSDAGYCVVEQVLTDATATPFTDLMTELVLDPLGMARSRFAPPVDADVAVGHDQHGAVVVGRRPVYPCRAAAGLWSTPAELAGVLRELSESLRGGGRLGLTRELAHALVTGQPATPWAGLGTFVGGPADDVRITSLGWGVGFQCALRARPHRGDAVVVMTNLDPGRPQEEALTGQLVRAVEDARGWRDASQDP